MKQKLITLAGLLISGTIFSTRLVMNKNRSMKINCRSKGRANPCSLSGKRIYVSD